MPLRRPAEPRPSSSCCRCWRSRHPTSRAAARRCSPSATSCRPRAGLAARRPSPAHRRTRCRTAPGRHRVRNHAAAHAVVPARRSRPRPGAAGRVSPGACTCRNLTSHRGCCSGATRPVWRAQHELGGDRTRPGASGRRAAEEARVAWPPHGGPAVRPLRDGYAITGNAGSRWLGHAPKDRPLLAPLRRRWSGRSPRPRCPREGPTRRAGRRRSWRTRAASGAVSSRPTSRRSATSAVSTRGETRLVGSG